MSKIKDVKIVNGRIQTKNFSLSSCGLLNVSIIDIYGGGTEALKRLFCLLKDFEDEWELENHLAELLLKDCMMSKRTNLTAMFEKKISEDMIKKYQKRLKKDNLNKEVKKQYIENIKDCKEVLQKFNGE